MSAAAQGAAPIVAVIDYGSGNLRSAEKALERAARERGLSHRIRVTADPEEVRAAERVVLPGVGAFADCKAGLLAVPGLLAALEESVRRQGKPFLGICVGMQLLAARGLEHGVHEGLSWIGGEVRPLAPKDPALKVPHMGWNTLDIRRDHALLADIAPGAHAYFVHSYHLVPEEARDLVALTDHGGEVTAIVARGNLAGTQFHPEKSQALGLALLGNFLAWRP